MNAMIGSIALGALLVAPVVDPTPGFGSAAQARSPAGSWVLNEELSDKPTMPPAALTSPAAGGGVQDDPRSTRRGDRAGGIAGVAGPDERRRGQMRETIRIALRYPRAVTIAQDDSSVTFVRLGADGEEISMLVLTNGRKLRERVSEDLSVEAKGEWKNDRLQLERAYTGGGKILEALRVSDDGQQLINEVKVQTILPGRVEFRLVYDRVATDGT